MDLGHPDLLIAPGFDVADDDSDPSPDLVDDDYPHGTAMAGIAAARGDNGLGSLGVAPMAEVLPVKALGGRGGQDDIAKAILYAARRDATVIANAWSYSAQSCGAVVLSESLAEALESAETEGRDGLGAVVLLSAGNAGCDLAADAIANAEHVVVIGAHDRDGCAYAYANFGTAVDLLAPSGQLNGEDALVTTDVQGVLGYQNDGDYGAHGTGTSAATAAASGVFALVLSANPELSAQEARDLVCATAIPSEGARCGRIDAAAAVRAAKQQTESAETGCQTSPSSGGCALLLGALAALLAIERQLSARA